MTDRPDSTDRPALDRVALTELAGTGPWTTIRVRDEVGSTNAEITELARHGGEEGVVVTAESQSAGRGRADRGWVSPPRAGIAVSMLLRPRVSPARWSWLPLLAGVALAETVTEVSGVQAALKWPNDLLVSQPPDGEPRKAAGILAEVAAGAVALGIGLNVTLTDRELPRPDTTSLQLAGASTVDRTLLLTGLLTRLGRRYQAWLSADGDPVAGRLRRDYLTWCHTIGQDVRVMLPDDHELTGTAVDIDGDGRLCVDTARGRIAVAAGDVHHVRLHKIENGKTTRR